MLNHWVGMGRLVADPEMRTTNSGTSVVSFTLAVERDFDKEKKADFISCVAWKNTAEFISRYFRKGQMMAVAGSLQSRSWEDRDGNKRTSWEIKVNSAYFAEKKSENLKNDFVEVDDDGDVPF